MRHYDHRVAVLVGKVAQARKADRLCAPISRCKRGLIEQQDQRLLRQGARQHHALLFSAGDFVHPAIAQMFGAHLGQGAFGDGEILVLFKPKRAAVGMAALQNVVAGAHREDERAFLLHEGDALGAGARVQMAGLEAVQLDAARERSDGARDQAQQRGFSAGVGAENGHEFALARLERGRLRA